MSPSLFSLYACIIGFSLRKLWIFTSCIQRLFQIGWRNNCMREQFVETLWSKLDFQRLSENDICGAALAAWAKVYYIPSVLYFCLSIYLKTSEKKTPIDAEEIFLDSYKASGWEVCFEFLVNLGSAFETPPLIDRLRQSNISSLVRKISVKTILKYK